MLFTYPGKALETSLSALDVSNNLVMEIKRLSCKPTSPEMVSALFFLLFPDKFQHSSGQDMLNDGNSEVGVGVSPVVPVKTQLCCLWKD